MKTHSKIGTDGVFIGAARIHSCTGDGEQSLCFDIDTYDGAEIRANRPTTDPAMYTRKRAAWPSTLAACAIVCALDHGNAGAAAIVGIWWFAWAVSR